MKYPLIIEPQAELDLERAFRWYNEQLPARGRQFLECVEKVFDRICITPELHALAYRRARLTLVKRFPYVVCYLFDGENVHVIAVFHGHRDPEQWKERVS
jgi:plasmid stabilization system protein ParE